MTEEKIREITVQVPLIMYRHGEDDLFAARLRSLGLTAYGNTPEDATNAIKKTFKVFVSEYRKRDLLIQRLQEAGVKWYWTDEYLSPNPDITVEFGGRGWNIIPAASMLVNLTA